MKMLLIYNGNFPVSPRALLYPSPVPRTQFMHSSHSQKYDEGLYHRPKGLSSRFKSTDPPARARAIARPCGRGINRPHCLRMEVGCVAIPRRRCTSSLCMLCGPRHREAERVRVWIRVREGREILMERERKRRKRKSKRRLGVGVVELWILLIWGNAEPLQMGMGHGRWA